jgi:hypothetical protein
MYEEQLKSKPISFRIEEAELINMKRKVEV